MSEIFNDFDKLRSGRMKKLTFRRALGTTKLLLQESELSILEDQYAAHILAFPFYLAHTSFSLH